MHVQDGYGKPTSLPPFWEHAQKPVLTLTAVKSPPPQIGAHWAGRGHFESPQSDRGQPGGGLVRVCAGGRHATNHTTTVSEVRLGSQRGVRSAVGDSHSRGTRRGRWQACEIRRARAAARNGHRGGDAAHAQPVFVYPTTDHSTATSATAAHTAVGVRRRLGACRSGRLVRDGGRGAERHAAHWWTSRTIFPPTYPDWIPVDTRLTPLGNEVRLMTHLHGGFVAGDSDGNPEVTPNGFGPGETQSVFYTNQLPQMPASLLWFHDHGLGTTRLNVFAGPRRRLHSARRVRYRQPSPIRSGFPAGPTRFRWSSRTASSTRTERFSTRPATSRAPPGSASTSATSCSSTARYGHSLTSSRGCTGCGSSTAAMRGS